MKRLVAVLVAAVLAMTVAGYEGASASTVAPPASAAYVPAISFHSCGEDEQCAQFAVPLDWSNPDGEKITLAVRKRVHTSGPYRGVLLANPGGPGGSGTGMVGLADAIPLGVGRTYDVVGFDPRGVGASQPALRCNPRYFGTNRPSYVPRTKRLMRYWTKKADAYAARCGASAARKLLPHLTTLDTVRDMDALRQALVGTGKMSFYGYSYGSYLGQVYATRHPDKVGRFVLDGVVDPATWWYQANLRQEVGFDRNLNQFFRWVARHPGAYGLGRDWRKIRRGYNALLVRLDRRPAYHGKLGPSELTDAILGAAYYVYDWDYVASAYSRLVRKKRGGQMFSLYASSMMGDDNGYAVYLGVQCSDVRRPAWRRQVRDAWRIHRRDPFLAWDNTWYNAPCRTWPAHSLGLLGVNGSSAASKGGRFLLVNETLDAATPYSGALRARSRFPSSRLIAGVGGTTHSGSLSGVSCVDNRVASFLATGALPARRSGTRADVTCPPVPRPTAIGFRAARTSGAQPDESPLRAVLREAQRPGLR